MFDLRFMRYCWNVDFQNVACTKISAKLLDPLNEHEHTLQSLLKRYLGTAIDKSQRTSDWFSEKLTTEQVIYAATDVIYLPDLMQVLGKELEKKGLLSIAKACFDSLPTMVWLDVAGYKDIYGY